jgi:tRNA modification GTPase
VFSTADTIVAIATPPGRGGIGVVRLSGVDARQIAERFTTKRGRRLEPRRATFTTVELDAASSDRAIDHVIVTYFPAPASYTGDDVVEISAHGSPVILQAIVSAAIAGGARLADPGEFTLRAFINGRMDLMQAEAVADLIESVTPLQARAAFDQLNGTLTREISAIDAALFDLIARLEASVDFPDEGYHFIEPGSVATAIDGVLTRTAALLASARTGRVVREGLQVAIVGEPNVGKSSLFNALVGTARAIVTEVPGTTRDLVSETIDLEGLRVTLLDTAGARETVDVVESEGVARSRQAAQTADLTLLVADQSRAWSDRPLDIFGLANIKRLLLVASKADLPAAWQRDDAIRVAAPIGLGLEGLRQQILSMLDVDLLADRPGLTNVRHIALVERAQASLIRARWAASDQPPAPEEFLLADLQESRAALEEVTGKRASDELLQHIFSRFCIGK